MVRSCTSGKCGRQSLQGVAAALVGNPHLLAVLWVRGLKIAVCWPWTSTTQRQCPVRCRTVRRRRGVKLHRHGGRDLEFGRGLHSPRCGTRGVRRGGLDDSGSFETMWRFPLVALISLRLSLFFMGLGRVLLERPWRRQCETTATELATSPMHSTCLRSILCAPATDHDNS